MTIDDPEAWPYFPHSLLAAKENLESTVHAQNRAAKDVRDAVAAARQMRLSWAEIGDVLGTTRQAAAARFGGDELREHLVAAWYGVEMALWKIASALGGGPLAALQWVEACGMLTPGRYAVAEELFKERTRAVHDPSWIGNLEQVEVLTDRVIGLAAELHLAAERVISGASCAKPLP